MRTYCPAASAALALRPAARHCRQEDTDRRTYGLKEDRLAKLLLDAAGMHQSSPGGRAVLKWCGHAHSSWAWLWQLSTLFATGAAGSLIQSVQAVQHMYPLLWAALRSL